MTWKRHIVSKIYLPAFFVFFILVTVGWAKGQDVSSTSTIIDRLDKKLWVSVPAEYSAKLLNFVLNDTIMRTRSATAYTEEFIINEMKKDWWISKQNQLLFIWSSIYWWISKNFLYDRLDDENEFRANEYEKALKQINSSYEEYKKWFKAYMEKWIAELNKQSAELDKQSAESLTSSLENLARFYNRYKKDPSTINDDEVRQRKENWKQVIQRCKDGKINYKDKLSPEMLKFYGVE